LFSPREVSRRLAAKFAAPPGVAAPEGPQGKPFGSPGVVLLGVPSGRFVVMPKKPFFREFDGWWYAQTRVGKKRKQVKLVKGKENEQEAYRAFCRLMAEEGGKVPTPAQLTVASVCDLYLDFSQRHHEPRTYQWYKDFLQDFCDHHGRLSVADLKPFHVNRWLDLHPGWGDGGRRCGVTCVKRAFNWAEGEGLIPASPVRAVKKPAARSRDRVLTPAERKEIFAAIRDQAFRIRLLVNKR